MDKRYIREKVQLMLERPFYGSLIVRLQLVEWEQPTFGTDGEYLYCPKKCEWSSDEIRGVLAHEALHCALGHVFRLGNRDKMKWNVAADYAVNYILTNDNFRLPQGHLLDHKFDNMHAEKIYNKLPDPIKIKIPIDLIQPGSGKGKGKDGKGKGQQIEIEAGSVQPLSEEDRKAAEAKAKELEQEWKEYLAHAVEKNRGFIPGGMKEFIEELLFPKISWEDILYRYLQASKGSTDFTAYPFDRRHIHREVYLPSMTGDSIEICVGIDSSGSISHQDLVDYFGEIRGICGIWGEYTIHVFICDAAIHQEFTITAEDDIPKFAVGRGGTSFVPVFNRIKELELDNLPLCYFTDLDGEFPQQKRNDVYWIIQETNYTKQVPFGTIVTIKQNGKKR